MDSVSADVEVCFEQFDARFAALAFGVAFVTKSAPAASALPVGQRVLAPTTPDMSLTREIDFRKCIRLEPGLPSARAMLVPDLAMTLAIWDSVRLELGEVAAYTSGSRHEALMALVAAWCTGRDVIRIEFNDGAGVAPAGVQNVNGSDPQLALEDYSAFHARRRRLRSGRIELESRSNGRPPRGNADVGAVGCCSRVD